MGSTVLELFEAVRDGSSFAVTLTHDGCRAHQKRARGWLTDRNAASDLLRRVQRDQISVHLRLGFFQQLPSAETEKVSVAHRPAKPSVDRQVRVDSRGGPHDGPP